MFYLDKNHNPRKNAQLLAQLNHVGYDAHRESVQLFQKYAQIPANFKKTSPSLFHPFSIPANISEPSTSFINEEENIYPEWKKRLDEEYNFFMGKIAREVNVVDFGAIGDGITDNTVAFNKAIGNGGVKIYVPEGVFVTKGLKLPSWTFLFGAGKGRTTIKLHNEATKGTRLITNANHWKGNHHLFVGGMSLDWNAERLGGAKKTSTGGNHSSCLTFAKVTYGWVKDVEGINPGLHCFDITSTLYNYSGDGYWARGGSSYVWLDNLNGYGFGDDGITTHHSEKILVTNSHLCDPSGRAHEEGFSNSNGIEIDDGSRNIMLVNNSTARCFGGVEIKAHENSSAAANVQIVGHLSVNDNRSFNFRHIGHHKKTDRESLTAYNIIATNLAAIAPIFTDLYKGSTPRGLVVSAYKNVVINHFTLIGDPDYNYKGYPVIAIQYRARNICLNHVSIKGFKRAGANIKVFGGANRADSVRIQHLKIQESAAKDVEIGKGIEDITVEFESGRPPF